MGGGEKMAGTERVGTGAVFVLRTRLVLIPVVVVKNTPEYLEALRRRDGDISHTERQPHFDH